MSGTINFRLMYSEVENSIDNNNNKKTEIRIEDD